MPSRAPALSELDLGNGLRRRNQRGKERKPIPRIPGSRASKSQSGQWWAMGRGVGGGYCEAGLWEPLPVFCRRVCRSGVRVKGRR